MMEFILYEDKDWLVVDKPTGMNSHAEKEGALGLLEWLALHMGYTLYPCSRLDKGTSGVLLFAKNRAASGKAQLIHEQDRSKKIYRFMSHKRHKVNGKTQNTWQRENSLDGKSCLTRFKYLSGKNGAYCYEAEISRGRTHQIRRHASLSGVPLIGDQKYGGCSSPRLSLHCCVLQWPGIRCEIASSAPSSFMLLEQNSSSVELEGAVALERRLPLLPVVSNSFRLIHRGELPLPISIDIYDGYLLLTSYDEGLKPDYLKTKLDGLLQLFKTKLTWKGVVLRYHVRNPHQKKLIHNFVSWGEPIPEMRMALEHDQLFGVNLNDSQHVGLFLDQRDSRRRVFQAARGKRVANLFSFTCSFSVAAVMGGAEVVFSVDLAKSTLMRGKENFTFNGLDQGGRGKFIQEDVLKWLGRQERKKQNDPEGFSCWDIIICDPPVFASGGKGKGFHVEKQWPRLVRQIHLILGEDGIGLFANNHRGGKGSFYEGELKKYFRSVVSLSPPLDFPSLTGKPDHVRIYWCQK